MSKLYLNTLAAAFLFEFEMKGQISDGKYENSRPYSHWMWVQGVDVLVDPNGELKCERNSRKKYTLNEWTGYISRALSGQDLSTKWAIRALQYSRLGMALQATNKVEDLDHLFDIFSNGPGEAIAEALPARKEDAQEPLVDIANKAIDDYMALNQKVIDKHKDDPQYNISWAEARISSSEECRKYITEDFIEAFYKWNGKTKPFTTAHNELKKAVNNIVY